MRVTVGRRTRSSFASSLGVSGPWRSIVARAEVEVGVSPVASAAASWRSRRAVRTIPSRNLGGGVGEWGVLGVWRH